MKFTETELRGVFVLEVDKHQDERGFFGRTWCSDEVTKHGLVGTLSQASISYNKKAGTLRGMHYQAAPHEEEKVVSCSRGAVFDAVVDLRPTSPTFRRWVGYELTEDNHRMLYIPAGCAHGFQTLKDDSTVDYKISAPFAPGFGRGVRWNDAAFGIRWPEPASARILSERDRNYPDFVS